MMILDLNLREELERYVPAPLLERLDAGEGETDTIRHLGSLYKAVTSFLPLYLTEDDSLLSRDYRALRRGTFMFADVSGFTALSERLQMQSNSEGAENLTLIMNEFFATMLEILAKSDGMLLKFAGDALLAFFPASEDSSDTADLFKATRTALRMQRAMRTFQPIAEARFVEMLGGYKSYLYMSVGLARGNLFEALVGNAAQREHIVQGELPSMAMDAEAVGEQDDVIVNGELADLLHQHFTLKPLHDDYFQVVDDLGEQLGDYEFDLLRRRRAKSGALFLEPDNAMEHIRIQLERLQLVGRYVPPAVLNELVVSSDYHLHSANRMTTTMFVHVTGFSELLAAWGEEHIDRVRGILERYYNLIHQIAASNGGTLNRTDPYKLGIKLLITFGALVTHPDDPDRAVDTALEMNRQLSHFNTRLLDELPEHLHTPSIIQQRIGITQGHTFSGEVGWKARREYTVMGDDVNLAARLMAKADNGDILISERVYRRVSASFSTKSIPPLQLKGKRFPINAYLVTSDAPIYRPEAPEANSPFIGRDLLLHTLTETLRNAVQFGQRAAAELIGEAGSGKTRLGKQVARAAESLGCRVAWVTSQPRNTRKRTWDLLVRQLLDIDPMTNSVTGRPTLHTRLEKLGMLDYESALSELCFDITPVQASQKVTADRVNDLFKAFSEMSLEDRKKSGVFGFARRSTENQPQAASSGGLWNKAEQRTSLAESLARFVAAYSLKQPVMIVIDNLQHENAQALAVIKHLLSDNSPAHLMVLLAHDGSAAHGLNLITHTLHDLRREESASLTRALLRVGEIGDRLESFLWTRTDGRPLFIESMLHMLIERDYLDVSPSLVELKHDADTDALPENVRELMMSDFDRQNADAQLVIRAASVLTDFFTLSALQAVSEMGDTARLTTLVAELVEARIFCEVEAKSYSFRHRMMQEAVYASLPRSQRLRLHRAGVTYWRQQPESEAQVMGLAYHLSKSGLLPAAIEAITRYAEQAQAKGDLDAAIGLYTHALTIFSEEKSIQLRLEELQRSQAK
jgi:adenylate cyclase